MRRLEPLGLSRADCERFAPVLARAAALLDDAGEYPDAAELRVLSACLFAVVDEVAAAVADIGQSVADASLDEDDFVTLSEWCELKEVPERTARRWASTGRLPARKASGGWLIRSTTPPIERC
ncbi:MAG: helix-turn-helix domain-containing protein [Ilumatobacter sp.]|nr:helix-turn-helix domain-containing protein [Ilumatobacter sp.]